MPLTWDQRIARALAKGHFQAFESVLSEFWETCKISEVHARFPTVVRLRSDNIGFQAPLDPVLYNLGRRFNDAVLCYGPAAAQEIAARIDTRVQELIREAHEEENRP
jgi:hypothetical protein